MKQKSKIREGSRQKRTHEKTSKSPAQRLLASNGLKEKAKEKLEDDLKRLNPFELRKEIREREDRFWGRWQRLKDGHEEEVALVGPSPLRSEGPTSAKKEVETKEAMVTEI